MTAATATARSPSSDGEYRISIERGPAEVTRPDDVEATRNGNTVPGTPPAVFYGRRRRRFVPGDRRSDSRVAVRPRNNGLLWGVDVEARPTSGSERGQVASVASASRLGGDAEDEGFYEQHSGAVAW